MQWRRGWKVLLRSRTKKKETDPLNEEQRQRNLQKGREALQRFRDKQHAMVSTSPGPPRRADAVTAPALLTPPPERHCQSPVTFVCASPAGSFNTPPTVPRRKASATSDDALHEGSTGSLKALKACALTLLGLRFDDLARQKQQLTMQALAAGFVEDLEALEYELRPVKAQQDLPNTTIKSLQDILFDSAVEQVIYSIMGHTSSRGSWETFCAAKEAFCTRKTSFLHIGRRRFSATQDGRDINLERSLSPDNPFGQMISAPPLRDATPWTLCDPSGSLPTPVTRAAAALVHDLPPHAWVRCVIGGTSRVVSRSILSMTATTTVLTIALPSQYGSTPHPQPTTPTLLQQLLFQRDATSTSLFIALPPLQDEANVPVPARQSISSFEWEPGPAPDLRLLHLHPTLLKPRWPKDLMRTLTLTLPLLTPFASRDSRVDVVGVCGDPPRPLHLQSNSAWQCEMRQGTTQADKPRSDASGREPGSSPDLHLHPTLQPRKNDDSTRTPAPTLPPLNPVALCDSQQDADGVCGALTGPLHLQRDSAWQCELSQGTKQADNPRSDAFDGEPGSCPFVVSTVETSNMREVRLGGVLGASAAGAGGCAWPL